MDIVHFMPDRILANVKLPDFNERPKKEGDILRTAEDLFMQFGYHRVTVEEICREAHVSKVTFYKYFSNKFAVLEAYLTARLELGWETFDRIRYAEASMLEKMKAIIAMKESTVSHFTVVFYRSLLQGDDKVQRLLEKWQNMGLEALRQFFADGQASGEISSDYNVEFLLHVWTILAADTSSDAVQQIYMDDLVKLSKDYLNFIFFGVSGPPTEEHQQ